jgi:hypothetical protein
LLTESTFDVDLVVFPCVEVPVTAVVVLLELFFLLELNEEFFDFLDFFEFDKLVLDFEDFLEISFVDLALFVVFVVLELDFSCFAGTLIFSTLSKKSNSDGLSCAK